jgi:N-acetylmuramoyl-L-alanine amidase
LGTVVTDKSSGRLSRRAVLALAGTTAALPASAALRPLRPAKPANLPLVFLDPGHGGKDPGAIGVSGTFEKQIAFSAAQELARQLRSSGRYRVVMSRDDDVFIPLEGRVVMAQSQGAALFMSIHADALTDHTVRGASVYTLAAHASDQQTAALAVRENAADRFAGPNLGGTSPEIAAILGSLVQRETRTGSARMARAVVASLRGNVELLTSPARRAAFVVLKSTQIPSVLVEMGFMSNPLDEAALRQSAHRTVLAQALHRAIDGYFG